MKAYRPFNELSSGAAPADAKHAIMRKVDALARRAFLVRMSSFALCAAVSVIGFVASCAYAWHAITTSGFGQYVSLAFSGSTAVFSKELGYALVESLPALGFAFVLATAGAAVWSVSKMLARPARSGTVSFA